MAEIEEGFAIAINNAYKQYDSSAKILKGLSMTVKKGTIYGLLGASGCGKTTLLSCIVGNTKLDAGSIKLCIKERSRLGFMPQDLSLFEEFSIEESFFYYGRVYNMSNSCIQKQIDFIVPLLQIPEISRTISSLSGGQKRRVSFGTALLPSPDILILDEPTVGQDSLLRFSIWEHLQKITAENTTIIITTHYIEEARLANTVGFMYDGVLLDEGNPDQLLSKYECNSLEDVFLCLCYHYTNNERRTNDEPIKYEVTSKPFEKGRHLSYRRLLSQWIKNYLYIKKNVLSVLLLLLAVPIIDVLIITTCIGNTPYDLPVSIVNLEINSSCFSERYTSGCNKTLGCRFIDQLPDKGLIIKQYSNHMIPETVGKTSQSWASIIIPEDFTETVGQRYTLGSHTPDAVVNKSFLNVMLDRSNTIIADRINTVLVDSMISALKSWNNDCGWPVESVQLPMMFKDPIYGSNDISFMDFMAPGILCLFTFVMPLVFSMAAVLYEKVTGTMDRSLIAGVLWIEFMLAHIAIASIFMAIQVFVMMYITFEIHNIYYNGSLVLMFFLLLMQGFSGMGCGLLVAVLFNNEAAALNFTNGVTFGLTFLAGILWPKEGMHWIASYLRVIVPVSVPTESLRSIIVQGETIESFSVVKGFVVSLGWIAFFVIMSLILMQRKNK